jgi:hypothetical protein
MEQRPVGLVPRFEKLTEKRMRFWLTSQLQ